MTSRSDEPMTRRHIWIEDDTWERLHHHFDDTIGPSAAVRKILKTFLATLDARAAKAGSSLPPMEDV